MNENDDNLRYDKRWVKWCNKHGWYVRESDNTQCPQCSGKSAQNVSPIHSEEDSRISRTIDEAFHLKKKD